MLRHAVELGNRAGRRLDLHWSSLAHPGSDDCFWSRSVPLEVGGARARALAPHDQLLHVCLHGVTLHRGATVRWVADAVKIVASSGHRLDWDLVVEQARERRVTPAVAEGLRYLRDGLDVPVPAAALERLLATPTLRRERAAHRARMAAPEPLHTLLTDWERYRRTSALGLEGGGGALGFPSYVQRYRGFERSTELIGHVASRLLERVRGVVAAAASTRRSGA